MEKSPFEVEKYKFMPESSYNSKSLYLIAFSIFFGMTYMYIWKKHYNVKKIIILFIISLNYYRKNSGFVKEEQ